MDGYPTKIQRLMADLIIGDLEKFEEHLDEALNFCIHSICGHGLVTEKYIIDPVGNISVRTAPNSCSVSKKIGRNDLCLCGSGKKYKKCCGK